MYSFPIKPVLIIVLIVVITVCFALGMCSGRRNASVDDTLNLLPTLTPLDGSTPIPTLLPEEMEAMQKEQSNVVTNDNATVADSPTRTVAVPAFTMNILGTSVPVAVGVDEETLSVSPGWQTTSARPGENGVCVVFGHRNREHLLVLKDIDYGDVIRVTTTNGTSYNYRVESMEILESDNDLYIPMLDGKHLMIVTCYPFYYTGHAPQKFVCTCVLE